MRRAKSILAAAAAMAVMMVGAAPAMADDSWFLEDPTANSDDVELFGYWWGDPYFVELEPEWVDGEWTWVVDEFEPAEEDEVDEFGWTSWWDW